MVLMFDFARPDSQFLCIRVYFFLPAGHAQSARPAGPKVTLRFLRLLVYIFVRPHLSRAQ